MRLITKPRFVIHRKIAWLLVFLILSLITVGYLIYATKRSLGKTSSQISRLQVMTLLTAESNDASWRFLQSGDPSARRRIQTCARQLLQALDTLHRLTNKNCDQDSNTNRLAGLIAGKHRSEDSLLTIPATSRMALATPDARTALSIRLAAADSTLHALIDQMTATERALLAKRKEA